ncbi:MAG TPA: phosphotransferase [Bryobacteraceae bacterium]|nr:phosphotransferase [Bryobacteraceae bacterium]
MGLALLTPDTVLGYLQERRLVGADGAARLRVLDLSRRNHNLAVEIDGRPRWFVKQMQYNTAEVATSLRREASWYRAAEERAALAALAALMPRCADFDAANSILVLDFLDGVNAAEAHRRVGPFDARVPALLGRLIGTLHNATAGALESAARDSFPRELPWVLRPGSQAAGARSRFVSWFERDGAAARALAGLRAMWQCDTLIHGDARLENFIFCRPADPAEPLDVRLVDWELAGLGDGAWDCANVMQHYWAQWTSPAGWDDLASVLRAFWAAYAEVRGLSAWENRRLFRRATMFTAARLVQTAYEQVAAAGWTPPALHSARLARLLLIAPGQALQGLEDDGHPA